MGKHDIMIFLFANESWTPFPFKESCWRSCLVVQRKIPVSYFPEVSLEQKLLLCLEEISKKVSYALNNFHFVRILLASTTFYGGADWISRFISAWWNYWF